MRGRVRQACEEGLEALEFVPDPAEEMSEGMLCRDGSYSTHFLISTSLSSGSPQHGAPPPLPLSPSPVGGGGGGGVDAGRSRLETELVQQDPPEKMSYTEQAAKRGHCQRLTSFIRLCNYLMVTMLHHLTVKSVSSILSILHDQLAKPVEIADLVQPIPDDIDEQVCGCSLENGRGYIIVKSRGGIASFPVLPTPAFIWTGNEASGGIYR